MYTVERTAEWTYHVSAHGSHYEVNWLRCHIIEMDYVEYRLSATKDGEKTGGSEDDVWSAKQVAANYRLRQLHDEYQSRISFSDDEAVKTAMIDVFERSLTKEYMGQLATEDVYYTEVMPQIFDKSVEDVHRLIWELVDENRIGVNGFILISHEQRVANYEAWEKRVGHKMFSRSDLPDGLWGCHYCGASGWLNEVAPTSISCGKDAHRDENGNDIHFSAAS
jgi:hypothetical protein